MWFDHVHLLPPASSSALLPHISASALGALASSGAIAPSAPAPSSPAALVLTPEQMTAAILELRQAVAGIRAFLAATTTPVISYQYGMPYDGTATTSFPVASTPLF